MTAAPVVQLLDATLAPASGAVAVPIDGETVVFHSVRQSLTVLDPVGTVVWTLLDGTVTLGTLCAELADAYQAPPAQVEEDVLVLVRQLLADGLLAEV